MRPLVIISVLFSVNIALLLLLKKIKHSSYLKIKSDVFKGSGALLIALIFFCGYMFFFKEHSLTFECHKETMICTYSRSTEFNKTLRPVKTYDISLIDQASTRRYRSGKHSHRYYVILNQQNASFIKTPIKFSNEYEAQDEADRFNVFLFSSQKNYAYIKYLPDVSSAKNTGIVMTVLTLSYFLFYILGGFGKKTSDTDKEHKNEDYEDEEYENDNDEIEDPRLPSDTRNDDDLIRRTRNV